MVKILIFTFFVAAIAACSKIQSNTEQASSVAVVVYQDKNAYTKLDLSGTATGSGTYTYKIKSLPSWASFDESTGYLSGIPKRYNDSFTTTVTRYHNGSAEVTLGPYAISVYGNPLKDDQWHLNNFGQSAYALYGGTSGEDIHMGTVIADGIDGTGIRVAISDTGTVNTHPGLSSSVLSGESRNYLQAGWGSGVWTGDPDPGTTSASNAHGTAVASLAVETGWNGIGIRGVAPAAKFAGFKFLPAQTYLSTNGALTVGVTDQFNIGAFDVANYSWGYSQCQLNQEETAVLTQIESAATTGRSGKGSLMSMSAGNSYDDTLDGCGGSSSTTYYGNANASDIATTPYVFVVGAVNANGKKSSYSSPGSNLTVSAPGGEYGYYKSMSTAVANQPAMVAADFVGCAYGLKSYTKDYNWFNYGDRFGGSLNVGCKFTATMNGTSSAAPVLAGALALILDANSALTWREVKYILAHTSDVIDSTVSPSTHPDTSYNLSGHTYEQGWVTNAAGVKFMNYYGFGRINVAAAVAMAKTFSVNLGTFTDSAWADDSGTISLAIPDASATGVTSTLTTATALTLEAVQVEVSISDCSEDIGVELTSPSGTKSILLNINSLRVNEAIDQQKLLTNAFYGEPSVGTWTLKVIDGHSSCSANLTNWKLNLLGH